MKPLKSISWPVVIILCLTLGLAPYTPEPHVWQKLQMLLAGTLNKPIDIFDLFFHLAPALLVLLKLYRSFIR